MLIGVQNRDSIHFIFIFTIIHLNAKISKTLLLNNNFVMHTVQYTRRFTVIVKISQIQIEGRDLHRNPSKGMTEKLRKVNSKLQFTVHAVNMLLFKNESVTWIWIQGSKSSGSLQKRLKLLKIIQIQTNLNYHLFFQNIYYEMSRKINKKI